MPSGASCGTYAGWNAHKRYGQPVCDECKDAAAQYMREYRLRTGQVKRKLVPVSQQEIDMLIAMRWAAEARS